MIPGAREPDWGPADHGGGGGPGPGPGADDGGQAGATVAVAGKVRRGALLRRGITVRAKCAAECRVDARARKLARGRAKGTGTVRARVRLTGRGRRAVKHGARRLALKVKVRQAGAATKTYARAVKIRG